jgi:hypothetical protein
MMSGGGVANVEDASHASRERLTGDIFVEDLERGVGPASRETESETRPTDVRVPKDFSSS